MKLSFLNLLFIASFASSSTRNCYWLDGSIASFNGQSYTPCSSDSVSTCCLLSGGDTCNAEGLCENPSGDLYRNACTDPSWKSPDCLPLCPDIIQYAQLNVCADGSYCCTETPDCCTMKEGVFINANKTLSSDPTSTTSSSSSSSSQASSDFIFPKTWNFIINNGWLATPIVAAIGWIQTWVISAMLVEGDYGFVADRRYAGLAKRTVMAAMLVDSGSCTPSRVIGCVAMDPGLASMFDSLYECRANWLSYTSWIVQVGATLYAIFVACYVWVFDTTLKYQSAWIQFPLLLGVLNINRGTWAVAAIGSFLRRKTALYITTGIAVAIDMLFIIRAFEMAWHIDMVGVPLWVKIMSYLIPSIEASIFFAGIIAASFNIHYIPPIVFIFLPAAIWLALGPFFVIAVSITSHFNQDFLGVSLYP